MGKLWQNTIVINGGFIGSKKEWGTNQMVNNNNRLFTIQPYANQYNDGKNMGNLDILGNSHVL